MNYENISEELKTFLTINQDDHNERKFQRILNAKFPGKPFDVNVFIKTHKWIDLDEDSVIRDAENFLVYYDQNIASEQDIWNRWEQNHPSDNDDEEVCDGEDRCETD